jgi:bifunctional non-homologous end joining protein LigD
VNEESLSEYQAKRTFEQTPEPVAEVAVERNGPLLFVIQKHDATRLHYDFRLELDGVLKSWAVPKGFSYNVEDKHVAVMVEDHPFDYGSFEGTIPKGNYGAGEVIVWDTGAYWCDEDDPLPQSTRKQAEEEVRKGIEAGKLSFYLRGTKLKGRWALIKLKSGTDWLLIKHRDRYDGWKANVLEEDGSVLSGYSIADLQRGLGPGPRLKAEDLLPSRKWESFPLKLRPMLASSADAAFDDPDWVFEPKLDGIRVLVSIQGESVRIESRNGLDLSSQFPALRENFKEQLTTGMVLDGEIVAFDETGPSFNAMLKRLHLQDGAMLNQMDSQIPCVFYAFDLLHFEGWDLRGRPLLDRRRYLEQLLLPTEAVQLVSQVREEGTMLYQAVLANGLEGVMAKGLSSTYEAGRRSSAWLKIKSFQTADLVVGGYSKGSGGRGDTFGAFLLGFFEGDKLIYVGNVGSGFNDSQLDFFKAHFDSIVSERMPFTEKPPSDSAVTWVRPETVVEVKFQQITPAGILRSPVFLRMREDVDPKEVGPIQKPLHIAGHAHAESAPKAPSGVDSVVESVLKQLDNKEDSVKIDVDGAIVGTTSLNKQLWPANKELGLEPFTKRDLLIYLSKVSGAMIDHLRDRPLTMIRFPEGIYGESFFQKHWEQRRPEYADSVTLFSEANDVNQTYLLVNNLPTLLWLGQLGTLEFHVWGSRCVGGEDAEGLSLDFVDSKEQIEASVLNYPDFIKFDIDPYVYSGKEAAGDEPELHKEGFEKGKTVAFWLKAMLDGLRLPSFVKTSGKTGLHIFVPIKRDLDYTAVRGLSESVCRALEIEHPRDVTTEWSTKKRTGKIFMDYNMNVRSKTLNSPYSPRALATQAVSMPVTWEDLKDVYPTDFLLTNAPERLAHKGDAWAHIMEAKRDMADG